MALKQLRLCFDIDDTLTYWNNDRNYLEFKPIQPMIDAVNALYDQGHHITLYTARGMGSVGPGRIAIEIVPLLVQNLAELGVKYDELLTHKPVYDFIIDDKALSPRQFLRAFNKDMLQSLHPDVILETK